MAAWDEFSEELRAKNLKGYWEVYQGEDYREPHSSFEPHLWKWEDIYPAILKAGELVDFEASVRRVLMLRNPPRKRERQRSHSVCHDGQTLDGCPETSQGGMRFRAA